MNSLSVYFIKRNNRIKKARDENFITSDFFILISIKFYAFLESFLYSSTAKIAQMMKQIIPEANQK